MRLNPDCIRDVILYVEENSSTQRWFTCDTVREDLSQYDKEVLDYHVFYLADAHYIKELVKYGQDSYRFTDLTPNGHQLAQDIRNNTIWEKTKSKAQEIGSFSIPVLQQIASTILTAMITQ